MGPSGAERSMAAATEALATVSRPARGTNAAAAPVGTLARDSVGSQMREKAVNGTGRCARRPSVQAGQRGLLRQPQQVQ
jgi:hypothetical protein